ncbi:MAG: serine hydrolase [Pirellulaceae bacterium]
MPLPVWNSLLLIPLAVLLTDSVFAQSPKRSESMGPTAEAVVSGGVTEADTQEPRAPAADADYTSAFDKMLADYFPADGPGVVALVAKDGKVLYHRAFGLANMEFGVPMPVDARFCIGSITKSLTATGILRLQEQGRLSIEDPITKYLPDYPAHGKRVRIKHLLSHTSGVHNYNNFDEPHPPGYFTTEYSNEEFIGLFKDIPLDFEPGTRYEYSNSGYSLLGSIIERVSEKSFDSFLQDEFCRPLGLRSLSLIEPRLVVPGRTTSYFATGSNFLTPPAESRTFTRAKGGGIETTAIDLFRWCDALVSGRILRKETLASATRPFVLADGSQGRTGYGWFVGDFAGSKLIAHDGLTPGYSSSLTVFPKERIVALILSNCNWYAAPRGRQLPGLPHRMAATILGKPYDPLEPVTASDAKGVPGIYQDKDGLRITITRDQGRLFMRNATGRRRPLARLENGLYYAENSYQTLRFESDGAARASVIVSGRSRGEYKKTADKLPAVSLAQTVLNLVNSDGLAAGLAFLQQHQKSDKYYLDGREFQRLAVRVYESGNSDAALELWRRSTKLFPNQTSGVYLAFARTLEVGLREGREVLAELAKKENGLRETDVNTLGYAFLRRGDTKAAIAFFEANVAAFPDSWNVYDSLAEAYLADGQTEKSRAHYRRAVILNPEHWDGIIALRELEE